MRWIVLAVGALIAGCGSDTAVPFTGTFSGTQTGTQAGTPFSQTVSLILTQSGDAVTGTYNTGSTSAGTVAGTASGTSITGLTITQTGTCAGTATGDVSLSGNTLTGSLSGTFGSCGAMTSTVSLTKQ